MTFETRAKNLAKAELMADERRFFQYSLWLYRIRRRGAVETSGRVQATMQDTGEETLEFQKTFCHEEAFGSITCHAGMAALAAHM